MKSSIYLLSAVLALFAFGCKEVPIVIPDPGSNPPPLDTAYIPRRVLVEELTGVHCPNCPGGSAELIRLDTLFGDTNVIIVSIHAAQGLSNPFPESQHDFQTTAGTDLANYIGSPLGYPSAAVDRVPVNNSDYLLKQQWSSAITRQLDTSYQIRMSLNNDYNPASRALHMRVGVDPRNSIAGNFRMTVVITEDSIVDPQQVSLVYVPNYMHRHVMRHVVTAFNGDVIGALNAQSVITKEFDLVLPADWVPEHCSVVAFVHSDGNPDKTVLQAVEAHVLE